MFASAEGAGIEPARLSLSRLPTGSRHLSGSPSVVCLSSPTRTRTRNTSVETRDDFRFTIGPARRKARESNPHVPRANRGLAIRPGKPYPATFRSFQWTHPELNSGSPPRQGGVFPLDHEPVFSSGPPRSRTPITWVQAKCPAVERAARLREVRPGIEPDPRPYQGRVLPKHLQTVVSVIPGGIEPPISWVSSRRLCRWTTGSCQ